MKFYIQRSSYNTDIQRFFVCARTYIYIYIYAVWMELNFNCIPHDIVHGLAGENNGLLEWDMSQVDAAPHHS
jgi:hypothetical protein